MGAKMFPKLLFDQYNVTEKADQNYWGSE